MDFSRLIEHAFPLKQTSLDSVHEKNVRHGHISTLHIWPARRPLAACRAALIATLLPDPGDAEKRKELCEKIAGTVVKKTEKKKMPNGQTVERIKEETEGGILHWGRETENAETLEWFRQEIRKAYGGRAPKVLDPFAGGGAIPLEAMRLGCEVTAVDINPVAWFILKCTLEYPQKIAGQTPPLPEFILQNDTFMAEFFTKFKGYGKAETKAALERLHDRLKKKPNRNSKSDQASFQFQQAGGDGIDELQADLAWHVCAWGQWVLDDVTRGLAKYYPTYADFEPIKKDHIGYEHQPMRLVPLKEDGTSDIESLNAEFTAEYIEDKRNPRWVAKPTVAYLWARTVACKNCRATVPLLKTRWLCKRPNKRVLLTMEPNADRTGVAFDVETNVPVKGGNAAQKREHDKRLGEGTMSRAGAKCPCCGTIMTGQDIQIEGQADRLSAMPTCTVVDTAKGKDYRPSTQEEITRAAAAEQYAVQMLSNIPFGKPTEPIIRGASRKGGGSAFTAVIYGMDQWNKLFTTRQIAALGTFVSSIRSACHEMKTARFPDGFAEAVGAYLACGFDRMLDFNATTLSWISSVEAIGHTFARFALPITWDYSEAAPINPVRGGWEMCLGAVMESQPILHGAALAAPTQPRIVKGSATQLSELGYYDAIVTDPPYYDAIPYSDLMDYFYVWERRVLKDLSPAINEAHTEHLSTKWDHEKADGELIDDAGRHGNNAAKSKQAYEDGMARVFVQCANALRPEGRLVIVFANKQPDAWETLVSAIIRAGFVIDGSWPIQTEQAARMRAQSSAALASSVWLVGKKRLTTARPGWDNSVLEEMRANISVKLREFWDAGIRGPDFVWAATGPAMEAYSKHPIVRKANSPGEVMGVGEFLNHVRRMVVDYIVGQVLSGEQGADMAAADRLDEVSAYYLLHRHDFGLDDAPVGACILYATACGLSDAELDKTWDILAHAGSDAPLTADEASDDSDDTDGDVEPVEDSGGGSNVKLKAWNRLSTNSERSLLESISNHIGAKGAIRDRGPTLPFGEDE